jgi:hypothetical protein
MPSDCIASMLTSSCCLDHTCVPVSPDDCGDAGAQLIEAADYDQSCKTDSDCIAISEGNFACPGTPSCQNAAINKSAYAQYQADVAKTHAASCVVLVACPFEPIPCCRGGTCHEDFACFGLPTDGGTD